MEDKQEFFPHSNWTPETGCNDHTLLKETGGIRETGWSFRDNSGKCRTKTTRDEFVITKYQEIQHEQAPEQCQCPKGFSIVQAIIHMKAWNTEGVTVNGMIITPEILFKYGLLRKILFTKGEQASRAFLSQRIKMLVQDIFAWGLVHKGFVCFELNDQPPDFTSHHPCFTKQEVKIQILHYQTPKLDIFTPKTF